MALEKKLETQNMALTADEERRVDRQLQRLERRLTHYSAPVATVMVSAQPAQRRVQVDLRVQLGPLGAHLISHQAAETADQAVALAVDDVLRQEERRRSTLTHEASYGVPSRREAREHRRQPVPAPRGGDKEPPTASGDTSLP